MSLFEEALAGIAPMEREAEAAIQAHLNDLTKPPGSLGRLEELAIRYCLARNTTQPLLKKKILYTFAGDHGVAAEGVSAYPQEVTPQMVRNMLAGGAAVNVLARHAGIEVRVVDIGVADPLENAPGLIRKKVRPGTDNIVNGPAMSDEESRQAIEVGIELAWKAADEGADLIATGEMGIANTTPSSALFAALLPCEVPEITGRGTGIDDERLAHKIDTIRKALEANRERVTRPLSALAAVGGLEIAGICGLVLGATSRNLPVVVDGFISTAGAFVASRLRPAVRDYLFFSHQSAEPGHAVFFERFDREPILNLGMRLGEGTGAAIAVSIIEAAVRVYNEMATFSSAGVSGKA